MTGRTEMKQGNQRKNKLNFFKQIAMIQVTIRDVNTDEPISSLELEFIPPMGNITLWEQGQRQAEYKIVSYHSHLPLDGYNEFGSPGVDILVTAVIEPVNG